MTPIVFNPELTFTVVGALLGVVLTLMAQAANAYVQRRSERALKTYDVKLETFTGFILNLENMARLGYRITELRQDPDLSEYLRSRQIQEEVNALTDDLNAKLTADPPLSPEELTALRDHGIAESARYHEIGDRINQIGPRTEALKVELAESQTKLRNYREDLQRQIVVVQLIAQDDELISKIHPLVERVEARELVKPSDYQEFLTVARQHIKRGRL